MNRRSAIGQMIGAACGLAAGMLGLRASGNVNEIDNIATILPAPDFNNGNYVRYRVATLHIEGEASFNRIIFKNAGQGWHIVSIEC